MMTFSRLLIVVLAGTLMIALGGMALFKADSPATAESERMTLALLQGDGVLDGKVFLSKMGPAGQPADVEDNLVFGKGLFVSSECQARCDYPARPYFTRSKDGTIQFLSETKCPYKDATILWRGVVEGERISGEATWTLKRWYWSIERVFWFEGELIENEAILAQTIPLADQ